MDNLGYYRNYYGLGGLGLIEDSASNIMERLDGVWTDMKSKYEALALALDRWRVIADNASMLASVVATLATPWKRDPAWVDVSSGLMAYKAKIAAQVGAWGAERATWKSLDPKKPDDLAQLRAHLAVGKQIVDAMDMTASIISLKASDGLAMALGGPLLVWFKRMAQIGVSKLRRPAAAVGRGAAVVGEGVVATGKFVGETVYNVGSGAVGLISFVGKYGVPLIAIGAALYFLGPLIASGVARTKIAGRS